MIYVTDGTNPAGNHEIMTIGETATAKFTKKGITVNESKPAFSELRLFFTPNYPNFQIQ